MSKTLEHCGRSMRQPWSMTFFADTGGLCWWSLLLLATFFPTHSSLWLGHSSYFGLIFFIRLLCGCCRLACSCIYCPVYKTWDSWHTAFAWLNFSLDLGCSQYLGGLLSLMQVKFSMLGVVPFLECCEYRRLNECQLCSVILRIDIPSVICEVYVGERQMMMGFCWMLPW